MSNFMEIRPVGAGLFQTDGRTDGQTDRGTERHEQANSRFSQFFERAKNYLHLHTGKRRSKFSLCLIKHHTKKSCLGVEV